MHMLQMTKICLKSQLAYACNRKTRLFNDLYKTNEIPDTAVD